MSPSLVIADVYNGVYAYYTGKGGLFGKTF